MSPARVLRRWNAFWYGPVEPHRMALFRVAFGAYLLAYFASLAPHVEVLFSDRGVSAPYLLPDLAPPLAVAWLLFGAMALAALALTLGLCPRACCVLLLALFGHHYFLQLAVKQSSFERLIFIYLVILAFADSGRALAPGTRGRPAPPVAAWPERLLRFQTILLYLGAGLWKAFNPSWHTGALLYATLQGMWATPFGFWLVRQGWGETTWTLLSWGILSFELLLALALFFRGTRAIAIVAGAAFHLANCVVLVIPEFLVCLAPYAVFLPDGLARRLTGGPHAEQARPRRA